VTVPIAIPFVRLFAGTRFFCQAFVIDPLANNSLGAHVSAAAAAVIGER
jgi:hypothetical protein